MCLICMKYRIVIKILIIISLCQILLSYFENTSCMHARTHTCTCARTHVAEPFRLAMGRWSPTVTAHSAGDNGRRCFVQINTREGDPVSQCFVFFSRIKNLLGRTEMPAYDRMCFQTIRTV